MEGLAETAGERPLAVPAERKLPGEGFRGRRSLGAEGAEAGPDGDHWPAHGQEDE